MTPEDFEKIVQNRIDECHRTLIVKGYEYSRKGDRLWNFKKAATINVIHPIEALIGMMVKHEVSIRDICEGMSSGGAAPSKETIAEKFNDIHNYYFLLEGLIEEARKR